MNPDRLTGEHKIGTRTRETWCKVTFLSVYVTAFIEINVRTDRVVLARQILIVFHKGTGDDPHKVISVSMLGCIGVIHQGKIEREGIYREAGHTCNMSVYMPAKQTNCVPHVGTEALITFSSSSFIKADT